MKDRLQSDMERLYGELIKTYNNILACHAKLNDFTAAYKDDEQLQAIFTTMIALAEQINKNHTSVFQAQTPDWLMRRENPDGSFVISLDAKRYQQFMRQFLPLAIISGLINEQSSSEKKNPNPVKKFAEDLHLPPETKIQDVTNMTCMPFQLVARMPLLFKELLEKMQGLGLQDSPEYTAITAMRASAVQATEVFNEVMATGVKGRRGNEVGVLGTRSRKDIDRYITDECELAKLRLKCTNTNEGMIRYEVLALIYKLQTQPKFNKYEQADGQHGLIARLRSTIDLDSWEEKMFWLRNSLSPSKADSPLSPSKVDQELSTAYRKLKQETLKLCEVYYKDEFDLAQVNASVTHQKPVHSMSTPVVTSDATKQRPTRAVPPPPANTPVARHAVLFPVGDKTKAPTPTKADSAPPRVNRATKPGPGGSGKG